ncbi:tRNA lysidine(34) synthetase TilS [Cyanobacterium aponinum AL20118]|uniref:tRNA(Ile)-lysidine synthase n=1 Tax=Cyanobacterium aponinum AL20115 TaxID=3090662 RepID=A0AAF0Z912_9CHRO|nr:tRNA lysidine(34) synthetase TilS [Cyanobacterium aponinum]WPF87618.1 tRNA lysidine(34) synthetase TilS [Cyanobacterium aponinum AL20115]
MGKSVWSLDHARLHKLLKDKDLVPKSSRILIAVSGGQDSLCLARLCLDLQSKWSWKIAIAHFDHQWECDRGLSSHIAKICDDWGVNFYLSQAQEKIREREGEARKYRYEALINIATEYDFNYLLTGHTRSDRAETFIYNLVRGAGIEGLTALNWRRKINENLTLVRPLLDFTRQETGQFCHKWQLPVWEDKYNQERKFARNRIRLDLIPYLQTEFNPQIEKHLTQTAEILRADLTYLKQETTRLYEQVYNHENNSLKCEELRKISLNFQRRIVKEFLVQNLQKMPNFEQIEAVVKLIESPNLTATSTLIKNKIAQVKNREILIKNN